MPVIDAGGTVPERLGTLWLQRDQLIRGLRDAILFPSGLGETRVPLTLPDGMASTTTADGKFYFNPARTTADEIARAASIGRLNSLLGLGPYSKTDINERVRAGEIPIVVAEFAPDDTEVKAAWGTLQTAPEQVKALEASKTPGNFIIVTSPLHIIAARMATTGK